MKIEIETIPHASQRYETCGDYFLDGDVRRFRISDMGNEDFEFLVRIHEQIEEHLTRRRGITEESITAFDIEYESKRQSGDFSEPGDNTNAPYFREHQLATQIERKLASELGVDWDMYNTTVENLSGDTP